MSRNDMLRSRGGRRGDGTTLRLVRTMSERRSSASTNPWLSQNWGILAVSAATLVATAAFSLGTFTQRAGVVASSPAVGHRSLFAPPGGSGGVSIEQSWSRGGRRLQNDEGVVVKPVVEYATQLELFMCNPSLVVEGNDAYLVDGTRVAVALSRIDGLGQADTDAIVVTTKTKPTDADDTSYMCDSAGMLQWHAQIKYGAAGASAQGTTPAVLAAQANDYVAYSSEEFKSLLTAYINDEYSGSTETVDLSAADVVVATVGWIVTFPSEMPSAQEAVSTGNSKGIADDIAEEYGLWAWWVWLIYALLIACCLAPLCCFLSRRRRDDKTTAGEPLGAARKGRNGEGLDKIRGPEWGITELDFDGDHDSHQRQEEMKRDYDDAGKGIEPTAYRTSHRPGHESVSGTAWMQEAGKKSAWAQAPSGSSSRQTGESTPVRRFDIDDEDADGGVARLRGKHPQYSFDMHAGVGRGGLGGGGDEKKSKS